MCLASAAMRPRWMALVVSQSLAPYPDMGQSRVRGTRTLLNEYDVVLADADSGVMASGDMR